MKKGVCAVLLASAAYGIMPVFSRLAMDTGLNSQNVVLYRFLLSFLFSGLMLILTGTPVKADKKQIRDMGIFGTCGFGLTIMLLTCSYQFLPVGASTMFHFSYPLFVALAMAVLYGEKLTGGKAVGCLLALGGLACMARQSGSMNTGGMLAALLSGATYAVFVIAGKKAAYRNLPPLTVVFYSSMFAAAVFGSLLTWKGGLQWPQGIKAWGSLIMISLICTVFALCMLTEGIRILGAANASVINMTEPVVSVAAGVLIFGEPLTCIQGVGGMLIVLAGIMFVRREKGRKLQ